MQIFLYNPFIYDFFFHLKSKNSSNIFVIYNNFIQLSIVSVDSRRFILKQALRGDGDISERAF